MTALQTTRPKSDIYGFAIGGTVGMFIMAIGPITGACLNPQRMLGPAIIGGELIQSYYNYAWIYYIGDYLGGAIAGIVWYYVFVDYDNKELIKIINKEENVNEQKKVINQIEEKNEIDMNGLKIKYNEYNLNENFDSVN